MCAKGAVAAGAYRAFFRNGGINLCIKQGNERFYYAEANARVATGQGVNLTDEQAHSIFLHKVARTGGVR